MSHSCFCFLLLLFYIFFVKTHNAKINESNISTALNDASEMDDFSGDDWDFNKTRQSLPRKNAGQSDPFGSDSGEDQDVSINNKDNDINNSNINFNIHVIE